MPESADKLADALAAIPGCPPELVTCARFGYYHDFLSPLPMPTLQLVADLGVMARSQGLEPGTRKMYEALIEGVKAGEFDATPAESEAWAQSADGQAALRTFGLAAGSGG